MKKTLLALVVVAMASLIQGQGAIWSSTDFYKGKGPNQSLSLTTPKLQVWLFGVNHRELDEIDLGTTVALKGGKWYVSGYWVHMPTYRQQFLLPWVTYVDRLPGNGTIVVNLAEYVPLNGGKLAFYCSETTATWPVNRKVDIGLTASLFKMENDSSWPIKLGPMIKVRLDSKKQLVVRYQPTVDGSREARLRVELSCSF